MKRKTYFGSIESRIDELPSGSVFVTSDFCDMADPVTASKSLLRLLASGKIRRILRGIYTKVLPASRLSAADTCQTHPDAVSKDASIPSENEVTPFAVAEAIARSNCWNIAPCDETALYLAGLSEEEPRVWTFVTDGTYREYEYCGKTIRFLHTTGSFFSSLSKQTSLLIQVIRAYGKDNISEDLLEKLHLRFCRDDAEKLLSEAKHTSAWVYSVIRKICHRKTKVSL